MSGEQNPIYLHTQYKFQSPDLWWKLGVEKLQIHDSKYSENAPVAQNIVSPDSFDVELEVLDDDQLLDWTTELRSITKWRTLFTIARR